MLDCYSMTSRLTMTSSLHSGLQKVKLKRPFFWRTNLSNLEKKVAIHLELILELRDREIFDQNWGETTKNLIFFICLVIPDPLV